MTASEPSGRGGAIIDAMAKLDADDPGKVWFWRHTYQRDGTVQFSSEVTRVTPHWCPIHKMASDRTPCVICKARQLEFDW